VRLTDLLTLPVAALWQQKLRTLLTTLGVVFGAFVLAASLSIGKGVQETIDRESHRSDISRRVEVFAHWNPVGSGSDMGDVKVEGNMSGSRRERIRRALAEVKHRSNLAQVRAGLSRERLNKIAALPNVERMVPIVSNGCFALLGERSEWVQALSAHPEDESRRRRIVAGHYFESRAQRAVIVSEFLAYRLGLVNDADMEGLIGKPLRLEFRSPKAEPRLRVYVMNPQGNASREVHAALDKVTARLPGALEKLDLTSSEAQALRKALQGSIASEPEVFAEELTVVGVIRKPTEEELKGPWDASRYDADLFVPCQTALDLYFRGPINTEQGINQALVLVDSEKNVKDVVERISKLGLESRAATEFIERERFIYLLIFGGMTCVATVALLVSALGIANTMLMSVLERTREIGIMKAVGADDRHLLFVFLIEGALIGLLGGAIGLFLAWAASHPGDAWVRSMVARDIKINLKSAIFVFPPWITFIVLLFTVVVTILAAVYPARHAARVDPVSALRHE
jgi:putative ABC transport system permease protein